MAKKDKQVIKARNTIIAFFSLLVIVILGFGSFVMYGGSASGPISAGNDYRVVDNPLPRRPGSPIKVVEFFSYSCIHCKTFDPTFDEWAAQQAEDVEVSRLPANFSPIWALLARSYLAFESAEVLEQNHTRLFRAIHDQNRQFLTPDMVADYVDGKGISKEEFLKEFNSPKVKRAAQRAEREQTRLQISSTPSLVVAGKYVVGMQGGAKRALEIVDHLIELERSGTEPAQP